MTDERKKEIVTQRLIVACRAARDLGTLAERFTAQETKDMLESALFAAHILKLDENI